MVILGQYLLKGNGLMKKSALHISFDSVVSHPVYQRFYFYQPCSVLSPAVRRLCLR